jgi:hypothetical protein
MFRDFIKYIQESNKCTIFIKAYNLSKFVICINILHLITHYKALLALKL